MYQDNSAASGATNTHAPAFADQAAERAHGAANRRPRSQSNTDIVTEDSAALEFAARHAGKLLFDHDAKRWYQWNGSRWQEERTGLAFQWAREQAREMA